MQDNISFEWYIITAIGGKEDSISEALKEKINNFQFSDFVKEIKIFKEKIVKVEKFRADDPDLPKTMRNTKTVKWTVDKNEYTKTTTKVVNRFPGYIYINMQMDDKIWYAIRNTPGVLGFVGSTGKGAKPIPISTSEIERLIEFEKLGQQELTNQEAPVAEKVTAPVEEIKKPTFTTDLVVGETVEVVSSTFAGEIGDISSINLDKGTVTINIDLFGRVQEIELNLDEVIRHTQN